MKGQEIELSCFDYIMKRPMLLFAISLILGIRTSVCRSPVLIIVSITILLILFLLLRAHISDRLARENRDDRMISAGLKVKTKRSIDDFGSRYKRYMAVIVICLIFWCIGKFRCTFYLNNIFCDDLPDKKTSVELSGTVIDLRAYSDMYCATVEVNEISWDPNHAEKNSGKKREKHPQEQQKGSLEEISGQQIICGEEIPGQRVRRPEESLKQQRCFEVRNIAGEDCPEIGAEVIVFGKYYPLEQATNPGQFDEKIYSKVRGIDAKVFAEGLRMVSSDKEERFSLQEIYFKVKNAMFRLQQFLVRNITQSVPKEESGIIIKSVTGDGNFLDSDTKAILSDAGMISITTVSGIHIAVFGMLVCKLAVLICGSTLFGMITTSFVMAFYGIMTGMTLSYKRAMLMLLISYLATMVGRCFDGLSACSLVTLLFLIKNPMFLFDSGFLLGITATFGAYVSVLIFSSFRRKGRDVAKQYIRYYSAAGEKSLLYTVKSCMRKMMHFVISGFLRGAVIYLFMIPVLINTFFKINPLSIIWGTINIVAKCLILIFGGLTGILGGVGNETFRKIFVGPAYYASKLVLMVSSKSAELMGDGIKPMAMNEIRVVLYYIILAVVSILLIRTCKKRYLAGFALLLMVFYCPQSNFEVCFLDVGQGDCIYLRIEEEKYLIDCGSSNVSNVGNKRLIPFLKYKGVKQLDGVIVTHFDKDHISGIEQLLEDKSINIDTLYYADEVMTESIWNCIANSTSSGCLGKIKELSSGEKISDYIACVSPCSESTYKNANSKSIVLDVGYKELNLLLTGDSDTAAERQYAGKLGESSYEILKCGHHGSKYSSGKQLLDRISPIIGVISCSKYNSYGHPADELLERLNNHGTNIYKTFEEGMVSIVSDGEEQMKVSRFMSST